jgi:tRNA dimethylallyltransferase
MSSLSTLKISPIDFPNPLVVIIGPTAVGKTEIALQLAERFDGEIVSADSRLFYRGMNIGTAKPSTEELARVPHHLVDVDDPRDTWSLTIFQRAAVEAIAQIHTRGRLPFLVGGTGQYVRAVTEGWEVPQQAPDTAMREALERWAVRVGGDGLHHRLAVLDPEAARQIDARNVRRTIRAMEVILLSGRRFSEQRIRSASPYTLLMVGLKRPRVELYRRVDARIQAMLEAGLVEEVHSLLRQGIPLNTPTMSAIGYREIALYLRGRLTLQEAVVLIKRLTRRYIRQQGAWFREEDPNIHWFDVGPDTVRDIEALIRSGSGWIKPGQSPK